MNSNPRFIQEDVVYLGRVEHRNLPISISDVLSISTTPDITNLLLVKGSGSVVSVTNFLGGRDTQMLRIIGDGTTTVVHGLHIKTNTGANKLLSANVVYIFSYYAPNNIWYESS